MQVYSENDCNQIEESNLTNLIQAVFPNCQEQNYQLIQIHKALDQQDPLNKI
jgi:hypothetical protein